MTLDLGISIYNLENSFVWLVPTLDGDILLSTKA